MTTVNRLVLSAALALVLAACGGGGTDDGGGGGTTGGTTGTTTGGTTGGGTSGGGTSGGTSTGGGAPSPTSCQNDFTPARVAAGENCDPALNRAKFCPLVSGLDLLTSRTSVIPCDGVEVSTHSAAGGGFTTQYLAIRPAAGGTPSAIYMALHYLNANTSYYANLIRMSELAKARNVLVLIPQAPGDGGLITLPIAGLPSPNTGLLSRWPTMVNQAVENNLQLLDGVVADARNRFSASAAPLYVSGLSNGTPMAYFYACGRADQVEAVLAVAGTQTAEAAAICRPNRPVGLVIVHGTSDFVVPYNGLLGLTRSVPQNYADFKTYDQCTGTDQRATLTSSGSTIQFSYAANCASGRKVVLAQAINNGHNWPGDDASLLPDTALNIGVFGPALDGMDATIQGFDLLRYTAGR